METEVRAGSNVEGGGLLVIYRAIWGVGFRAYLPPNNGESNGKKNMEYEMETRDYIYGFGGPLTL